MVDQSKLAAQTDAVFKSSRGYAEGGMPEDVDMQRVDPVSGNEIPPGSLAAEVRDDIPAQLSEGEYVVPADVVRYYGVKFFEDLRGEAKMGWQSMEENGRIGGDPISPPGMEMADDELPFDVSEIQFMEIPDDQVVKAAEGAYVAGYGLGDFVKALFGGGSKKSSSSSASSDRGYDDSSNGKSDLDRRYEKAKSEYQQRQAERKEKSSKRESSWGDASENKGYQDMAQSMRDAFPVNKGPNVLESLSGFVPEMPDIWGSNDFTAREREAAKTRKGVNLLKGEGFADGGYALSEGDPGYEEKGALGLGAEGLALGGQLDVRKYINDAGDVLFVPFLDGVAQIEIPDGYYLASEAPKDEQQATVSGEAPAEQYTGAEDDDGYTKPMQSINFKELSNAELAQMLKQQQGFTGNAISVVGGALNPIIGIALKLAMMDTAKRVKKELERRAADPNLSVEEKAEINTMLEVAKKDQPSLIKRLFDKAVDKVEDVIDPTLSAEQKAMAEKVNQYNVPSGLGTESDTQKEERLMDQYVEAPTSEGVQPPSPVTVEELPPAPLPEPSSPLPTTLAYDDLLMGRESPVTKTLTLDEIISNAQAALGKAESAISKVADVGKTAVEKGMEAGKDFNLEETLAKLEADPLFFLKTITPQAYTPTPTVPRVATPKAGATKAGATRSISAGLGTPTTAKSSRNVGDDTNWSTVRQQAKQKSTQAIVNARNNLATKEEISDMSAAAKRVDDYLKSKEAGKPTGTYGFAEGGSVEAQYTGLDALKDMQKLNQYM